MREFSLYRIFGKDQGPEETSKFLFQPPGESSQPAKLSVGSSVPLYESDRASLTLVVKKPDVADLVLSRGRDGAAYLSWRVGADGKPGITLSNDGWHDRESREIVPGVATNDNFSVVKGDKGMIIFDYNNRASRGVLPNRLLVPSGSGPRVLVKAI